MNLAAHAFLPPATRNHYAPGITVKSGTKANCQQAEPPLHRCGPSKSFTQRHCEDVQHWTDYSHSRI